MAPKIKRAFSIDPVVIEALTQRVPSGNVSALVEDCLRELLLVEHPSRDRIEQLIHNIHVKKEKTMSKEKVAELGDEVKDSISGFQGIAIAKHDYIHGCTRMSVQPPVDKDGKLPESATFDILALEVVKKKESPSVSESEASSKKPGGPAKYMPKAQTTGDR